MRENETENVGGCLVRHCLVLEAVFSIPSNAPLHQHLFFQTYYFHVKTFSMFNTTVRDSGRHLSLHRHYKALIITITRDESRGSWKHNTRQSEDLACFTNNGDLIQRADWKLTFPTMYVHKLKRCACHLCSEPRLRHRVLEYHAILPATQHWWDDVGCKNAARRVSSPHTLARRGEVRLYFVSRAKCALHSW